MSVTVGYSKNETTKDDRIHMNGNEAHDKLGSRTHVEEEIMGIVVPGGGLQRFFSKSKNTQQGRTGWPVSSGTVAAASSLGSASGGRSSLLRSFLGTSSLAEKSKTCGCCSTDLRGSSGARSAVPGPSSGTPADSRCTSRGAGAACGEACGRGPGEP
ncbi:unnamed protein product [Ixodes persulcatus]